MATMERWPQKYAAYKQFIDNIPLYFGDAQDANIQWDGSNLVITGDIDISASSIAVDQGEYIYLDGQSGGEYIRSDTAGYLMLKATTGIDLAIGSNDEVAITASAVTLATNNLTLTAGNLSVGGTSALIGNVTLSANLYMPSGGVIDFNSADVTITHSTTAGGMLTFAGVHMRTDGAGQWQFRDGLQYLRSDAANSFVMSSGTTLHFAIGGTNIIDIVATGIQMNGKTISECGDIHFNASGAMIDDAPTYLVIKGGNTSGDYLELQANSADASPKLKLIGAGRSEFTGDVAMFSDLNVGGDITLTGDMILNNDVLIASGKKLSFIDTNSFIGKGLSAHMEITTDGELVITSTNLYFNSSGYTQINGANHLKFGGTTAYIYAPATGKLCFVGLSTAYDAIKMGTGSGGGIKLESFLRLHVTDGEGATEGQIWYDNSENVIKFFDNAQVRTVTSG